MKKIYRSKKSRIIGGVCGGISEYFDIDPILVRVLFIVLLLGDGISFLLYIILWIIMPSSDKMPAEEIPLANVVDDDPDSSIGRDNVVQTDNDADGFQQRRKVLGIALIVIGVFLLIYHHIDFSIFADFWPVVLVGTGIILLVAAFYRKKGDKNEKA